MCPIPGGKLGRAADLAIESRNTRSVEVQIGDEVGAIVKIAEGERILLVRYEVDAVEPLGVRRLLRNRGPLIQARGDDTAAGRADATIPDSRLTYIDFFHDAQRGLVLVLRQVGPVTQQGLQERYLGPTDRVQCGVAVGIRQLDRTRRRVAVVPGELGASESEELILPQRATRSESELVLVVASFVSSAYAGDAVDCVQAGPGIKLKRCSMKLICTCLGDQIDHRPTGSPVFRRRGVGERRH